jgi:hypothetical protein
MKTRLLTLLFVAVLIVACRGDKPGAVSLEQAELDRLVLELMPAVERATRLEFRETPRAGIRSRDEVRSYLLVKLEEELPAERLDGLVAAYRLMGLIPDTLDVGKLFVDLYTEQVAGFYEPDSAMLFAVEGSDMATLRATLSHELVHALQHQYLPLDSILSDRADADRLAAAQAVLEGQATVAMVQVLVPDVDILGEDQLWRQMSDELARPQAGLEVFNNSPLVIRTGLMFPYLQGAGFMRWFLLNRGSEQPYGDLMPKSTEQILHPARYQTGDDPVRLRFTEDSAGVIHEDTFGEFETLVLRSALAGITAVATDLPIGWGGDRLRVYQFDDGPALVWYVVFDQPSYVENFTNRVIHGLRRLKRPGYRVAIDPVEVGEHPGVRVVIAPEEWDRWADLPAVVVDSSSS